LRGEQAALVIADAAGPLRAAAAALLELRGAPAPHPKEALQQLVDELGDAELQAAVAHLTDARERRAMPEGQAGLTLAQLIRLAHALRERLAQLAPEPRP